MAPFCNLRGIAVTREVVNLRIRNRTLVRLAVSLNCLRCNPANSCPIEHAYLRRPEQAEEAAAIRDQLRSKNLACWCPLEGARHADVLLEMANIDKDQNQARDELHKAVIDDPALVVT